MRTLKVTSNVICMEKENFYCDYIRILKPDILKNLFLLQIALKYLKDRLLLYNYERKTIKKEQEKIRRKKDVKDVFQENLFSAELFKLECVQ